MRIAGGTGRRSGGFTLLGMLWFVGLAFTLLMSSWVVAEGSRQRVIAHKNRQMATAMAVSGIDYARSRIRRADWKNLRMTGMTGMYGRPTVRFESPDLGGGSFVIEATPQRGRWRVTSEGRCAGATARLEQVMP